MKWGVRHYQNEDGSYKPGAEGRYDPKGTSSGSTNHGTTKTKTEKKSVSKNVTKESTEKPKKNSTSRKQKKAQRVYDRIHSVRNDKDRMSRMSNRQLKSLEKAEKYWKLVAEGKKPTEKRGLIRRESDKLRSYNKVQRAGRQAAYSALTTVGGIAISTAISKKTGVPAKINYGKKAANAASSAASSILIDELGSKVFGHF